MTSTATATLNTSTTTANTRRIRIVDSDAHFADCASDSETDEKAIPTTTEPSSSSSSSSSSAVPLKVQHYFKERGCKLLFNGDSGAGKTSFLIRATNGIFPAEYLPTVFDNYVAVVNSEKYQVELNLGLWDTFGRSDYDRLRPLSYPGTDLMVFCFDVSARYQFESIVSKYIPEVKQHVPGATLLLLGLKSDLRNNTEVNAKLKERGLTMVSREEAEDLARKFNMRYMELSALEDGEGCKAALETFATMVVERYLPKPKEEPIGLFGLVKRMFSWTTSSQYKTIAANAHRKQIDEYATEIETKKTA